MAHLCIGVGKMCFRTCFQDFKYVGATPPHPCLPHSRCTRYASASSVWSTITCSIILTVEYKHLSRKAKVLFFLPVADWQVTHIRKPKACEYSPPTPRGGGHYLYSGCHAARGVQNTEREFIKNTDLSVFFDVYMSHPR